jgi:hypothetical protein
MRRLGEFSAIMSAGASFVPGSVSMMMLRVGDRSVAVRA